MKTLLGVAVLLAAASPALAQDQQLGARTKGMGGSYTAFEDDPVSVWLNPAGIATQPDQMSLAYQTYTTYPRSRERGPNSTTVFNVKAETVLGDPAYWPSYLGAVFQLGDGDAPLAIGVCIARPYLLGYAMDLVTDPSAPDGTPEAEVQQSFYRFRVGAAKDFFLRDRGTGGFFTHLSVGLGLDVGWTQWHFQSPVEETSDTSSGLGGGFGLLLGLYDNTQSCKVNLGVAYQSGVNYKFRTETDILPAFDMPQQFNVGLTFYLLENEPLRITIDLQWINWSATAEDPLYGNFNSFEDAVNFSIGGEYRVKVGERVNLYPRLGFRRFGAPWTDRNDLPMTAGYQLVLDTKSEVFYITTFGLGVAWTTALGKSRSIDLAGDVGGDSYNVALGLTYEF